MNIEQSGPEGANRIYVTQDRDQLWTFVNAVMNLRVTYKCGELLQYLRSCFLVKQYSATWSLSVNYMRGCIWREEAAESKGRQNKNCGFVLLKKIKIIRHNKSKFNK